MSSKKTKKNIISDLMAEIDKNNVIGQLFYPYLNRIKQVFYLHFALQFLNVILLCIIAYLIFNASRKSKII